MSFFCPTTSPDELEVFVGREVIDEERVVDVGSCPVFPVFRLGDIDVNVVCVAFLGVQHTCHVNTSRVGFDEVENEAEQRAFASSVVAHQSQQLATMDGVVVYVNGNGRAKGLLEILYDDIHIWGDLRWIVH